MSAALAAIAFAVSSTVRAETDRVGSSADGLRASYLASGSVERGIQWMLWGGDYRNPDGSPRFWEPNLPRMAMHYASGDAVVEMIPESAKMNLNIAGGDDLYRLVLAVSGDSGLARSLSGAIVSWRSGGGAPSLDFASAPTFRPRHASFQEIEELLLVQGMTPELYYGNFIADSEGRLYPRGGLRDCLSVWGSSGPFDANTASPALMEAVGVPPAGVAQIVMRRTQRPFKTQGELAALGVPVQRLGIGGGVIWTLRATARLRGPNGIPSEVMRTSSAVVKLLDRRQYFSMPVHVLRYYSDAWSQSAVGPPGPAAFGAPPPLPLGVTQ
jgi:hypothetical protein